MLGVGLADVGSKVAGLYDQEVSLFKFGRMPAMMVIDRKGLIRYRHYGQSMSDIPGNSEIFAVIDQVNLEEGWHA